MLFTSQNLRKISVILAALAFASSSIAAAPVPKVLPVGTESDAVGGASRFGVPPSGFESSVPGAVLASRKITLSALVVGGGATAWQLLYRTSDSEGQAIASITTVVLPVGRQATALVSVQVAEDASNAKCAPSVSLNSLSDPALQAQLTPFAIAALNSGLALSIPDYEGPESEFGAARQPGYIILDGIRAAENFAPLGLQGTSTPVALEGYSGGSLATGWASELQASYAPELNIRAAALGGFVTDLSAALTQVNGGVGAGLIPSGLPGMLRANPELAGSLGGFFTPAGKAVLAAGAENCATQNILAYPFVDFSVYMTMPFNAAVTEPSVASALRPMSLGTGTPEVPLFVYHAVHDEEIPILGADSVVAGYCARGASVTYLRDVLSEHATLEYLGARLALQWVQARLAGTPVGATCTTVTVPSIAISRLPL